MACGKAPFVFGLSKAKHSIQPATNPMDNGIPCVRYATVMMADSLTVNSFPCDKLVERFVLVIIKNQVVVS